MALWSDLQAKVYTLTDRPDLVNETLAALRLAVRTAHKSGKYWRDLNTYDTAVLSTTTSPQSFAVAGTVSRFRQIATIRDKNNPSVYFTEVRIDDIVDEDGYYRTDVYWAMGTMVYIRASNPSTQYTMEYYQIPVTTDASIVSSWIADEYEDAVVYLAAATVCGMVGEQEIKRTMEQLAALAIKDLQEDNIEITGR